jgi:predicted metalloprotease with PDZ domain
MYYMPDLPVSAVDYMLKQLVSTCAHEFMHIVTPLNLHSEEIGNFDFNNPKMSEHLWLYEGVTEYSAHYIQLRQGLTSLKEYVETVNHLLQGAARFNDTLPFTELSLGALDKYQSQYQNVYQKGALIGMCLDILIRSESAGSQGLKDVISKLLEKYGKQRSFKDADLFGEFTALTSPKVAEFFSRYVAGSERLPFAELFPMVGLEYKSTAFQRLDYGEVRMGFNQSTYRMKIVSVDSTDEFVKALGIKNDDDLVSVNGKTLNFFNIREAFGSVKNPAKVGDDFEMEVARTGSDGKEVIVKLNAKILKTRTAYDNKVTIMEHPTEEQMKLLKSWAVK